MECTMEKNKAACACTYDTCGRKGKCCECVATTGKEATPRLLLFERSEASYDRSFRRFVMENS
jgi:hypothetical protein